MMKQNIFVQYLAWQFADVPQAILTGWKNCLRFNLNYWSVPLLLKTLFSHWRRYRYSYGRGFNLRRYFEAFSFNMISRVLGTLMRSVLIIFGLLTEILVILVGAIVFFIWLILPLLLIGGIFYGYKILF